MDKQTRQITLKMLQARYTAMLPMDEVTKRKWAAAEASAIGRGGERLVSLATKISRNTVKKGLQELNNKSEITESELSRQKRLRSFGGGRKSLVDTDPRILAQIHSLVEPVTFGTPENDIKYKSLSTYNIAAALKELGYAITAKTVGKILKAEGYSLQVLKKTKEGGDHPDRDEQFHYINKLINKFKKNKCPIISVDSKKKELVGDFFNKGREWHLKGEPVTVKVYDFIDEGGKAVPYGVFDIVNNEGYVSVGTNHDTSEFAAEAIARWWNKLGKQRFKNSKQILILADGGGSNSSRSNLWKSALKQLSKKLKLSIFMSHYPPGTSKWNKIEHKMFSYISINWRGKPLLSFDVIIKLISSTTTENGLKILAEVDESDYEIGKRISKSELANLGINSAKFHSDWNYSIPYK
jgi:hypothetical protein